MSKIVFGLDAPEKNDVHIRHINNNAAFFPKRKKNLIASKYCIWKTSWANCLFTFLYIHKNSKAYAGNRTYQMRFL